MTHTMNGFVFSILTTPFRNSWYLSRKSGLGDHGPKGIQDFISSHVCNYICQSLELELLEVLKDTLDNLQGEIDLFGDFDGERPIPTLQDFEDEYRS